MEVRVVESVEDLRGLAPAWDRLYAATKCSNPFLTAAWTIAWVEQMKAQPFVVAAFEHDELAAVLPLVRRGRRLAFVEGDAYGFLTSFDVESVAYALIEPIAAARARWDTLVMDELLDDAPTTSALRAACERHGLAWHGVLTSGYPYTSLETDATKYEANVGKKVINEIKRRQKQLALLGKVEFNRLTNEADVLRSFETIVAIHRKRWQERSDTSAFGDVRRTDAMLAAARTFARNGQMALDVLLVDDMMVAYSYGFEVGGRYVYYSPGFDPVYAPYSVSKLLLYWQLSECRRRGLHEFDFSRGEETYKLVWATDTRRGRVVVVSHSAARSRVAAAATVNRVSTIAWLKTHPKVVHFKRVSLGRIRHRVSPAFLRAELGAAKKRAERSVLDRGVWATATVAGARVLAPVVTHVATDMFACGLPIVEPETPPDLRIELLLPRDFDALADTGRYDRSTIVHTHYRGARCYVALSGSAIAAYVWITVGKTVEVPELGGSIELGPKQAYLFDCYTLPSFRGRGLYPLLLRKAMSRATGCTKAFIVSEQGNAASKRGIEKAGFRLVQSIERTRWFRRGSEPPTPIKLG
jgi:CelD/BcsL family acetyltransferase involved in cellulose biosynthesis/GNAT superfamily N-acetyltransferase